MIETTDSSDGQEHAGEHVTSDTDAPRGANCPEGQAVLGGGARISTEPSSPEDEGKVTMWENRPRGNPPTGWYADVRINSDFTQDPNVSLVLYTYVVCTA